VYIHFTKIIYTGQMLKVARAQSSASRSLDKNIIISILVYMDETPKPVRWVGTSLRVLRSVPRAVRIDSGHALFAAHEGKRDPAAKPLTGFGGSSVIEIVASHYGNAWRAIYTVRFQDAIYVLHVFQKKSTKGIATPKREIDLIKQRLSEAERDYRARQN